jgi:hypothetical protein
MIDRKISRAILMIAGMIVLSIALGACGDEATPGAGGGVASSPDPGRSARYDITGTVEQLTRDTSVSAQEQGIVGSMLVVAPQGDTTSAYDKASVTITGDTRIWRPQGEGAETLTVDDLREGDVVIVTFTGPVAESYPVQATAESIEIVPQG